MDGTKMSDLIKRLRKNGTDQYDPCGLCDEAADEIERLQRRIDVLHEHDGTMCPLCDMEAEIERLQDQLSFMTKECKWFEVRYRSKIQEDENE